MNVSNEMEHPFTFRFIDSGSNVFLELFNGCDKVLKSVEILTIFLKDEETSSGISSQVRIRFEDIKSIQPKGKMVLSHKTWIDNKPANLNEDQIARLKVIEGHIRPYVLDISWENPEGKKRFQRIPVGH